MSPLRCDFCDADLPDGYVMQVDHRGRPAQALCLMCADVQTMKRRLRLHLKSPLRTLDEFARRMSRARQ